VHQIGTFMTHHMVQMALGCDQELRSTGYARNDQYLKPPTGTRWDLWSL